MKAWHVDGGVQIQNVRVPVPSIDELARQFGIERTYLSKSKYINKRTGKKKKKKIKKKKRMQSKGTGRYEYCKTDIIYTYRSEKKL